MSENNPVIPEAPTPPAESIQSSSESNLQQGVVEGNSTISQSASKEGQSVQSKPDLLIPVASGEPEFTEDTHLTETLDVTPAETPSEVTRNNFVVQEVPHNPASLEPTRQGQAEMAAANTPPQATTPEVTASETLEFGVTTKLNPPLTQREPSWFKQTAARLGRILKREGK